MNRPQAVIAELALAAVVVAGAVLMIAGMARVSPPAAAPLPRVVAGPAGSGHLVPLPRSGPPVPQMPQYQIVTARSKAAGIDPAGFAGPTGGRRLALITCGGPFDSTSYSYDDNVYAYAVPA